MTARVLLALCALGLSVGVCRAGDGRTDDDFGKTGLYLGLGPLWALENTHTSSHLFTGTSGATVNAEDTYGADGRIGYRLNRFVALEAQAQYFGNQDLTARVPGSSGSNKIGHIEAVDATANFKLYPLEGRFQPYIVGGFGLMWMNQRNKLVGARNGDNTEVAGRGGLGLDVYLDENFAVNVEGSYLQPASTLQHYPLAAISTGIQYHF